jgi:hypothetical protein
MVCIGVLDRDVRLADDDAGRTRIAAPSPDDFLVVAVAVDNRASAFAYAHTGSGEGELDGYVILEDDCGHRVQMWTSYTFPPPRVSDIQSLTVKLMGTAEIAVAALELAGIRAHPATSNELVVSSIASCAPATWSSQGSSWDAQTFVFQ